ncbi:M20/M25/M40 family metallo-hydrolase [Leptolyngbya sp. 15MV]|nr:M20/M25/M40 family metallo-hydrolase [Leptolyngbya sp. 15MV]
MPQSQEQYDAVKDQLNGAWILVPRVPMGETPGVDTRRGANQRARWEQRADARKKVAEGAAPDSLPVQQRILFDGVLGFISASPDDRVWTSGSPNWRTRKAEDYPPDIEVNVRLSDYDYINSRLTDGDAIEVEFNLPVTIKPGPNTLYNTVAEIRGTERPDEVVIICAHLDSWDGPGSQGTVDNGTGSAVTLEAARLLAAAGARPKRTIRFILWTGEEQGLQGARAYVQQQKDNWPRISAAFNDDGGTNYQGGLAVIREMVPYLAAATAPVNGRFFSEVDNKWLDVNLRVTPRFTQIAASDHFAFVEVGIPGFFWDEVGRADYWYAWHTQNDRLDQAIEEYLKQSAICSAVLAYQLANAPELLPRWLPEQRTEIEPIAPDGQAGPGQRPRN